MKRKLGIFVIFFHLCFINGAFAGDKVLNQIRNLIDRTNNNFVQSQQVQSDDLVGYQSNNLVNQQNYISNQTRETEKFRNYSDNPKFTRPVPQKSKKDFTTIKTLVPYEDLYKVLQKDIGKYFILPIDEFEALKKAKEDWIKANSGEEKVAPPLLYRINTAQLTGKLDENFAKIHSTFKIETFTDDWHEIPVMWGSIAIESVKLNGKNTTLKSNWLSNTNRQVTFGKLSQQNILQNVYQAPGAMNDILSQDNWKDAIFSLPIKGKGIFEVEISFMVPIQNQDDLYTLQFSLSRIPLTFLKLEVADFTLSIDSTSFRDFSIDPYPNNADGCSFIGWLGANSDLYLKWRRKFSKPQKKVAVQKTKVQNPKETSAIASEPVKVEEVKPVILPLVYSRSQTLVSLGETAIQGHKTIYYTISKAPVSSFSFAIPSNVEIVEVNSDRPQTHRLIREGKEKRLRVDFLAGREDSCRIEIAYEAPVDLSQKLLKIPEIFPVNVERELGTLAIEALTSVEVQPGNNEDSPLNKGVYSLDPLEVPQPLKKRAVRPLLLAYRQNTSPANILISVKRYQDVPQQTVVADSMEVKTTFTTNKTSNTLLNMKIRNNNKQYLQLQLSSGTEVISAFRSGKPVKLVAGKNDGKVQIPLEMSQSVGSPVEMNLQVLLKQPVEEMKWHGKLDFVPPMVDIPVSRFSWYLYAPEQYKLFDFSGTVKDNYTRKDPFFFRGFMTLLHAAWSLILNPELLFILFFFVTLFMLFLARNLLFKIIKGIWGLVAGIFTYIFSGKGFRLAELMIVMAIIGLLAAIAIPNFRKAREQGREKACYANMRVLLGAMEMYNMDNSPMMKSPDEDRLVRMKFLKSNLNKPERNCRYYSNGDVSAGAPIICRVHGAIDDSELSNGIGSVNNIAYDSDESVSFEAKSSRQQFAKGEMKRKVSASASSHRQDAYGFAKVKGMKPIKTKFVITQNYYALERDLIIPEIASNGALILNRTCPTVTVNYVKTMALNAASILAFILAFFGALYFVSGAFLKFNSKITFAAIIMVALSVLDLKLKSIGDSANIGLWLAIAGAVVWKIFWLFSQIDFKNYGGEKPSFDSPFNPSFDPSITPAVKPKKASPEVSVKKMKDTNPTEDKNNEEETKVDKRDGKTSIIPLIFILSLFVIASSIAAFAADDVREIRIMAPFKELSKVIPTGDRVVIIPEEDYKYLKDVKKPDEPEINAPQNYRFESVHYKGIIQEKGVRFQADFTLDLFNKGWKKIGLLTSDAVPTSASINGIPLALGLIDSEPFSSYGFMTDATGTKNVSIDFFIPMDSSEYRHTSKFNLKTIPVCLSTLEITANEESCEAWIDPGVLRPAEKKAGKTVFKAFLPPTSQVSFELYRNIPDRKPEIKAEETGSSNDSSNATIKPDKPVLIEEKTRISVRESNLLYFKEGFLTGTNAYKLKIKGGMGIATFSFALPGSIRVLKVENKLIEDWKNVEKDGENQLDITFKSKIRGETQINIEFEEDISNLKDENFQISEIVPLNVEQSFGVLGIGCLQTLEVSVADTPEGFSPIIAAEFLKDWKLGNPEKTPYAFKFLRHPNKLILNITRPEDIGQQTAVIDRAEAMSLLNEDGYLLTRIVYEVRNNSQQFLKVKLPKISSETTELWSTQVAGMAVRAGFDNDFGVYNLPIVRSPIIGGESQSFPVEIVYAIKTREPLKAVNKLYVELPQAHLPVSELNWLLYLPEGYELMKETGNLDRQINTGVQQKFLNNSSYFSSLSSIKDNSRKKVSYNQKPNRQQDRVFGMAGLLPVKFKIPTTNWSTAFKMLQIEPDGKAPHIEGILLNPRKGKGFAFQILMIFIGCMAGLGLIKMLTGQQKHLWFLFMVLMSSLVALSVYLKLYQADYFAQMGFSALLITYILFKFFAYRPEKNEDKK